VNCCVMCHVLCVVIVASFCRHPFLLLSVSVFSSFSFQNFFCSKEDLARSSLFLSMRWYEEDSFWKDSKCCFPLLSRLCSCSATRVRELSIVSIAVWREVAASLVMFDIIPHLSPNRILCNVSSPCMSSVRQFIIAEVRLFPPNAPRSIVVSLLSCIER
jgi:hypothetical protein